MAAPTEVHPKVRCPKCHKSFSEKYISTHLRRAHSVYGGIRKAQADATEKVQLEFAQSQKHNTVMRFTQEKDFVVLTDSDGGIWIAERVR